MTRTFTISQDTHTFESGTTALVGYNSVEKAILLRYIAEQFKTEQIPYLTFNNNDNMNLHELSKNIGQAVRQCRDNRNTELWILMDNADCGLSIDDIDSIIDLFDFVCMDGSQTGIAVFIIAAADSFELARGLNAYDVKKRQYRTFTDYEEYRRFILQEAAEARRNI